MPTSSSFLVFNHKYLSSAFKSTTKNNYIEIDNLTNQKNYINLKYYAKPDSSYMASVLVEIDFLAGFLDRQVNY